MQVGGDGRLDKNVEVKGRQNFLDSFWKWMYKGKRKGLECLWVSN